MMRCGVMLCDGMQRDSVRCAARRGVAREEGEGGLGAALAVVVGFDGRWRRWFAGVAEVVAEIVAEIVAEADDQGGVVGEAFEAVGVVRADGRSTRREPSLRNACGRSRIVSGVDIGADARPQEKRPVPGAFFVPRVGVDQPVVRVRP